MIWFFLIFALFLIGVGVAFTITFRKNYARAVAEQTVARAPNQPQAGSTSPTRFATVQARMNGAQTAQEFLGFESIAGGVVKLDACRFRAYVEVEPVSYYLMSAPEQEALEAGFRAFLDSLRWPVQICVNSVPLDLTEHLTHLQESANGLPPELRAYGHELAALTADWVAHNAPLRKQYVLVVAYDYVPNPKKAVPQEIVEQQAAQELENRVQVVVEALSRARLSAHRMDEGEIVRYLYQVYNRGTGTAAAARGLEQENLFALYVSKAAPEPAEAPEQAREVM